MVARRWPVAVAVAVLLVVLTGCSDDNKDDSAKSDTASTASTGPAAAPDGFRSITVEKDGFSLAVPVEWKEVPLTAAELDPFLQANPELTSLVGNDPTSFLEKTKFFAFDEDRSGTNVNVIKSPNEATVADLVAGLGDVLTGQLGAKDVKVEKVALPGGEVAKAYYVLPFNLPDGGSDTVTQIQFHFVVDKVDTVLTFTLSPGYGEPDVPDKIAATFRFL